MKLILLFLVVLFHAFAQDKPVLSETTFEGLRLRSIGPAVASGRVTSIAVHPSHPEHYFVGVASGGVWKTTNNGTTWTPVFDSEGSYSIGTVTLDPRNPNVVWVGTGENNSQRSVGYGDGVYRSDDGGRKWRNMGLKTSEHIGRIVIDPRDSNVVYVAAQGPLWSAGGERGLYKTTDGGATWVRVLEISENTGVSDVVMDPRNPDVLIAASWQRRRHVWTLVNGGPETAIYKSTDAGKSWRKISSGLPTEEMGRIGLAFSEAKAGLVYARIEAANQAGGIFRSLDAGESWEKRNPFDELGLYYGQIIADPRNPDRIYVMATLARASDDGGKTLRILGDRNRHIDTHTVWIDPRSTDHLLVGCDGGVYESWDAGQIWEFKSNLPVTQFYDVTVDNSSPFYTVCGGTQDNATLCGPSRTRNHWGIVNADWFVTVFGDGFQSRIDPDDPNTIYSESQYGGLVRYDRRTGERIGIHPMEGKGEPPLRWNWDSPLLISPHNSRRLYFGANKLFRSDDRGDSWRALGGDLTRALDRDRLPVMGRIWGPDAVARHHSTSFYSNLTALAESPVREGLLYTGSDDGLIQVSEDGGANWRKVESFPGVPAHTYVARIVASQHDGNTVYAAFDNHKNGDFRPYLLRSRDRGASWESIAGDLPARGSILALAEDHVKADLLFAGAEFGLYFTVNGGRNWIRLKGGLPTIAVRDLAIQKRENDLIVATFGRGIYILDDYTPLRMASEELLSRDAVLFPAKAATEYIETRRLGLRGKGFLGESFYAAENPPFGAVLTYYLKESIETAKAKRQKAEKEAVKKGEPPALPSREDLIREAEEEAPAIVVTISDAAGRTIRRLTGPVSKGIHRVSWDLRGPAGTPPGDGGGEFRDPPAGPFVMPGMYTAALARQVNGVTTPMGGAVTFEVKAENPALPKSIEFLRGITELTRAVEGASRVAAEARATLREIRRAVDASNAPLSLRERASQLERRVSAFLKALSGDPELARRQENQPPSIEDRLGQIRYELGRTTGEPTATHRTNATIIREEFGARLKELRSLIEADMRKLNQDLEAAGVPYTPGRLPELR